MFSRAPFVVGAVLLSSLLLAPTGAAALGLQVSPIKLHFNPGVRVQELRLSNAGDRPMVIEIKALSWSQHDNEEKLVASRDLLVTPPISEIAAGQRRSVRVGIRQRPEGACESTYRIEIVEVPPQTRQPSAPVNFRTRMLLPAFVRNQTACKGKLEVRHHQDQLILTNNGNAHLQLHEAMLIDGGKQWPVTLPTVGYLLSGSQYRWPLPADLNPSSASLVYKDHAGKHQQALAPRP